MKPRYRPWICLFAVCLGGCFSREVTVVPRPDGSGAIEVVETLDRSLVRYLEGVTGSKIHPGWFPEDAARERAATFGEGVELSTHRVEVEEDRVTVTSRYEAGSMDGIRIAVDPRLPAVAASGGQDAPGFPPFRIEQREPGRLVVHPPPAHLMPAAPPTARVESHAARDKRERAFAEELRNLRRFDNPFNLSGEESRIEVIRTLADSMRFTLRIHPEGVVTATNARHADAGGFLLFSARAADLLEDPVLVDRVETGRLGGLTWRELLDRKGVTAERSARVLITLREPDPTPE